MAIALSGTPGHDSNSTTSSAPTVVTSVGSCIMVAIATINNTGAITSIASSNTTWNAAARKRQTNGTSVIEIWYGVATNAINEAVTATFNGANFHTIDIFGISGGDTTTKVDNSNAPLPVGSTTGTHDINTVNYADCLLVSGYRFASTASPTAGSGWIKISGADYQLSQYKIVSATGTVTATITTGNGNQNGGVGDALFQAAAGGIVIPVVYTQSIFRRVA